MGTNKVCRSVSGAWVPTKYAGQYLAYRLQDIYVCHYPEHDQHGLQQSMYVSIQNRTGTGANKVCRSVSRTGLARVPTKYAGQTFVYVRVRISGRSKLTHPL